MQNFIPKRIIQTGKNSNLPLKEKASVCNLNLLNPDFEYLFFNDEQVEDFLNQYFPQYRPVFDSFPYRIQRYDFFRYLAVYHYGGFYFDLDVFLASSLSSLLESGCVFPFEGLTFSHFLRNYYEMDWQIGNYAFGAAKEHPFLQAVIENCVRAQNDPKWVQPMMKGMPPLSKSEFYILNTTGPGLISRTLAENPALAENMTVLFPEDVCDFRYWNRFGDYGVHLMDGSWRIKNSFLHRRLAMYWEAWEMRRLLKESLKLGKTRLRAAKKLA
jgi:hypothetical protein